MVTKYIWWDDIQTVEKVRAELRVPKQLHEWAADVAKTHGVSMNAFMVGLIAYAADSERQQRLRIEVIPSVRVTENKPAESSVQVPCVAVSHWQKKACN